ncbi:phage major capsid family protein [Enterococcus sp.]|uniref:phage major capsid family protein n=1 Tax=Enterococcus sp. TaxID=35783 RepID=UPI002FC6BA4F
MGLKELYELLKGIQANKAVKTKQLEDLQIKVKAATDEDLESLKSKVDALSDEIDGLITEETDVQGQIDEADESLKSLSKELEKAKQKEKGTKNMDYLKSKEAAIEYAKMLVDNQGKSNKDMQEQWSEHLKSKGVTGLDNLLPEPVLLAIQEEFKDYQGVLNHVTKDPRYSAKVVLQSVQNFAQGHKKGTTKKNANFAYTSFTINAATVYIKVDFDYADLKKDTTGRYFNYAMQQLAKGFIRAVERAIVIGDGLDAGADDKITEIKSIAEETEAKLFDTVEIDSDALVYTNEQIEAITAGIDKLYPLGDTILVTTKAVARKLKLAKDTDGKYLDPQPFAPISQTGNNILGYTVYVYDFMNGADNPIIAFADKAYALIGDSVAADKFDEYDVTVNKRDIELASVMGGRLAEYKSAIKFTEKI